jgi:hypothetical protein
MGLWADWQATRARRQRVEQYLNHLLREPETAEVDWLSTAAGDRALAVRELTFARRAIGVIVAERDALDDRTAADVAHQLAPVVAAESRRDPASAGHWPERWRAYTAALAVRGNPELHAVRLARVLLAGAGLSAPNAEVLQRTTQFIQQTRSSLNEHLRTAFGAASLPEDVRPSALRD